MTLGQSGITYMVSAYGTMIAHPDQAYIGRPMPTQLLPLLSGESGYAEWKTRQFGDIRVRVVKYSPGYKADHWCKKGHVILVLEGEMTTELDDGRKFLIKAGSSYQVGDNEGSHRTFTETGVKLFIVD